MNRLQFFTYNWNDTTSDLDELIEQAQQRERKRLRELENEEEEGLYQQYTRLFPNLITHLDVKDHTATLVRNGSLIQLHIAWYREEPVLEFRVHPIENGEPQESIYYYEWIINETQHIEDRVLSLIGRC